MKKFILFAGALALFLAACQETSTDKQISTDKAYGGLNLALAPNPEWQYKNLRLYPVLADPNALAAQNALPALKSLAEGMNIPGFRITERKRFGRSPEAWYNALTVQNKSRDTIFLMAGDVVTGGNQDRVVAYDDIVYPGTIKNIPVFCVEAGRSSYYDPDASPADKKLAAFRGYYNVASPQVRKAVFSGNQTNVWNAVASVTAANRAESGTRAYAGLETENDLKERRMEYLRYFDGKLSQQQEVVGVVAICGNTVLGVDIFGRHDLFQQQIDGLLHGFATEAAVSDAKAEGVDMDKLAIQAFQSVSRLSNGSNDSDEHAGKFSMNNIWLHLYRK